MVTTTQLVQKSHAHKAITPGLRQKIPQPLPSSRSAYNCIALPHRQINNKDDSSLDTDVSGYFAVDITKEIIVISFRGSGSVRNWLTDFNFPVMLSTICTNCFGSTGFYASWLEAQNTVFTAIEAAMGPYPNYKLIVTGHSLGGALATVAVGALRSNRTKVDMHTYGAPKIGLLNTASYISQTTLGSNYRVTHKDDPVPRMPPLLAGYQHVSPEYYIVSGNDVPPTAHDITVYTGIPSTNGNEKDVGFDVGTHTILVIAVGARAAKFYTFDENQLLEQGLYSAMKILDDNLPPKSSHVFSTTN